MHQVSHKQAYLRKSSEQVGQFVEGILGVFQKLIAAKATEANGFEIIRAIFAYTPVYVSNVPHSFVAICMRNMSARYSGF